MKEIKDYLHLYLGCMLKTEFGQSVLYADNIYRAINLNWKPILRSLSNMTDEEKKELWELIFKRKFGVNGDIRFFNSLDKTSKPDDVSRWVLSSGVERLGIQFDGSIWADSDLLKWKYNQHEVTKWLLSKHFDLFNLIPEGLAIDKTKIKALG